MAYKINVLLIAGCKKAPTEMGASSTVSLGEVWGLRSCRAGTRPTAAVRHYMFPLAQTEPPVVDNRHWTD